MRKRATITMDREDDDEETAYLSKTGKSKSSVHAVPTLISFGLLAVLLGLFGVVYVIDKNLPKPLTMNDEIHNPDAFITERARKDLKEMTDLGPRVAGGYQNEALAVNLLKRQLEAIIRAAHANQKIEIDFQVASGSHYLKSIKEFVTYSNLQNIAVKVHSSGNGTQTVLINSHFDSVPTSPGGSDDAINCAVMLEVLRKITRGPRRPLNNLIFLFNGAEETGRQASHAFITKHRWASDCTTMINLEAAGAGGKIILFQSGPSAPWLMKYYRKVPHPYGQVAGEEIFETNLIPSDTDFRIFRDYGGLVGLDMAFFKNGYRYHTKYDDFDHIPLGSLQHVGDNTLTLVRELSEAPEVAKPKENPGNVVFFDFLGLFMVTYSEAAGLAINYVVVLLSVALFFFSIFWSFKLGVTVETMKYLAMTFGAIIGGWAVAAVVVGVIAVIIDKVGYSMSWYANPWLIFGLFVSPTIALSPILLLFVNPKNVTYNIKSQIQIHCVRMIWTLLLFVGTCLNIRAMYAVLIPVLFNTVAFSLVHLFRMQYTIRKWQVIYMISLVIPTVFLMYVALTTMSLFIPVTGRIGSDKNSELIIGILSVVFTVFITSFFVALASLVKNIRILLIFLGVVFVVNFIIIFTPLGFAYTGNADSPAAERFWITHTGRAFHDEKGVEIRRDSGYLIVNMDRNSPNKVKPYVKDLARARPVSEDCDYYLCGFPLVHSKMQTIIKHGTWVPAGQPILSEPTQLKVLSIARITPTLLRYNISVTGPDRIKINFSPKKGYRVTNISVADKMPSPEETINWNDRAVYSMSHIYGKSPAPLQFTFDIEVPLNSSSVTTEIAVSGVYVHDNVNRKVPHYVKFLNDFPDWADLVAWVASYELLWI